MRVKTVKILLITSILSCVAVATVLVAVYHLRNITREEMIEISRNTTTVQEALEDASKCGRDLRVTAEYWSATYIRSLKQSYPNVTEWKNLPEDHGVWKVTWRESTSGDGIDILYFIDELTGEILFESVYYFG